MDEGDLVAVTLSGPVEVQGEVRPVLTLRDERFGFALSFRANRSVSSSALRDLRWQFQARSAASVATYSLRSGSGLRTN